VVGALDLAEAFTLSAVTSRLGSADPETFSSTGKFTVDGKYIELQGVSGHNHVSLLSQSNADLHSPLASIVVAG